MTPTYKNIHLKFKVNGFHYSREYLLELAYDFVKEGQPYQKDIGCFLFDWLDEKDYIRVNTSGSTGRPKEIKIAKQAMVNSALATGDFFGLKPGDTALYCLPAQYIAGKMMLIRAIILGLEVDIIEPLSNLNFEANKFYDFCAMVPMQLENTLSKINGIKTIIVGGAAVSSTLKEKLEHIESTVYETYGMTETVTHIALKQLNHLAAGNTVRDANGFKVLPDITISQDQRDCLVIEAPKFTGDKIITNDIVKLRSTTEFEWLGRFDNVINSGGVKLFPEQIEAKLQKKIKTRFFVASEVNDTMGEQLILVVESGKEQIGTDTFSELGKYEKPKVVYNIDQFVETTSGKIQRKKTLELIKK